MAEITAFVCSVYVIMGIDADENDHVIAVCRCFDDAKRYCTEWLANSEFLDIWVEKHAIQ